MDREKLLKDLENKIEEICPDAIKRVAYNEALKYYRQADLLEAIRSREEYLSDDQLQNILDNFDKLYREYDYRYDEQWAEAANIAIDKFI